MWHINKSNGKDLITQFGSFLEIIKDKKLEDKNWSTAKEIIKRSMSESGTAAPRITDSRIGTLRSYIYQMGLIKYEGNKNKITKSGHYFLKEPENAIFKQFIKFQFTNPAIIDYCKDIYVFPVIGIIKMLLDPRIGYLEKDEIGYFIFTKLLHDDDFEGVRDLILKYRSLNYIEKENIISQFKESPEGHVALKKASSAGYLMSQLVVSDRFEKENINNKLTLTINQRYKSEMEEVVKKYTKISPFPYTRKKGIEYNLWFEYIGDPLQDHPPQLKEIYIINNTHDLVVNITRNKNIESSYSLENGEIITHPFFNYKIYDIEIYIGSLDIHKNIKVEPCLDEDIIIDMNISNLKSLTTLDYLEKINELIKSKDYDRELSNKINYLSNKFDLVGFNKSSIRGARLEELVFKSLSGRKSELGLIDVIWKGKIDEYGIPHQTPGGKGNPDIVALSEDNVYIIELTTNASVSGQENSETLNIARHARNFIKNNQDILNNAKYSNKNLTLFFAAPIIHLDLKTSMSTLLKEDRISCVYITIDDLIKKIKTNTIFQE